MVLSLRSRASRGSHHPRPRSSVSSGRSGRSGRSRSVTTAMLALQAKSTGIAVFQPQPRAIDEYCRSAKEVPIKRGIHFMADDIASTDPLELATELTIAWLANPNTNASAEDVPAFLQKMHLAVINLAAAPVAQPAAEPEYTPAVSVRRSLSSKDHIHLADRRQAVQDAAPAPFAPWSFSRAIS